MTIILHKDKPYYNVALLLCHACGSGVDNYRFFFSQDKKWRDFACWFWSNDVKTDLVEKINKAQGIDLEDWYWANQ